METVRLMLGGDVMLGRNVARRIARMGPAYPLGRISEIMNSADLVLVNLECAITASSARWSGAAKAFYFGAPLQAIDALLDAGVDVVSLANNHVLDFGYKGFDDTLISLEGAGIGYAGAGRNIDEASKPACFERKGISFGMTAYCDHQQDFSAGPASPGINYFDLDQENGFISRIRQDIEKMKGIDWPILSLHWGPNRVRHPSDHFRKLARQAIEMGYGMIFGHSAHVFHGVEIYRGKPIFYACGDLVDDYYVDPELRNDHQLLFEVELSKSRFEKIRLHPVLIEDCRTVPAVGESREFIIGSIEKLCREMGTGLRREQGLVEIVPKGVNTP